MDLQKTILHPFRCIFLHQTKSENILQNLFSHDESNGRTHKNFLQKHFGCAARGVDNHGFTERGGDLYHIARIQGVAQNAACTRDVHAGERGHTGGACRDGGHEE